MKCLPTSPHTTSAARRGRFAGWLTAATLLVMLAAPSVHAAPVEGKGTATIDDKSGISGARKRALGDARRAALDAALGGIAGPVDKAAKKAVRKRSEAWTGAYRILEQRDDGKTMTVRVEVDIDTVRLAKRVAPAKAKVTASQYKLGKVDVAPECAPVDATWVGEELVALGAVDDKGSVDVDVDVTCRARGAVRYTHMDAATVKIVARSKAGVVTTRELTGFGADATAAAQSGVQLSVEKVGRELQARRQGHITVRIEDPLPAANVRRLEQAMLNSVAGVDDVVLSAIEPAVVVLSVDATMNAKQLGRQLEALRLPGFSVTIASLTNPDVLTIRLH